MKFTSKLSVTGMLSLLSLAALIFGPTPSAQALTWYDAGTGVWDNNATNWNGGTASWVAGGTGTFTGTTASTVTIGDDLNIGTLQFNSTNTGPYTFDNSGGHTISFTGAGITGTTTPVQILSSTGTVNFQNSASAGNSSIQISSSGEVDFNNNSTAGTAAIVNDGDLHFRDTATSNGAAITNNGNLFYHDSSTGGTSTITSIGNIEFHGAASGGNITLNNGGFLDISAGTAGSVTLNSLNNTAGGNAGAVILGKNTLQIGNGLTLTGTSSNSDLLDFSLDSPGTSGEIVLTGGSFTGASTNGVNISLTALGPVAPGTYTLIDWTSATANGVDLSDFNLGSLPSSVSSAHLEINGSKLQLVAVPEPASLIMPLAGMVGLVWIRRRRAVRVTA